MNKEKILQYINNIVTVLLVIMIGVCGYMMYNLYTLSNTVDKYNKAFEEKVGMHSEVASALAEIHMYYDEYAIQNNPDFELANDFAINFFVEALNDEYATYLRPEDYTVNNNLNQDYQVGVGISVVYEQGVGLYIVEVYEGSPADKHGLKRGDIVTHVNGKYIEDVGYSYFMNEMLDEEGTIAEIKILRDGVEIEKRILREAYDVLSVKYQTLDNNIGYVKIGDFTHKTYKEFRDALKTLQKSGVDKYIFDLRNNGGGYVDTVVSMLDFLVGEGTIINMTDRDGNVISSISSDGVSEFPGEFVVIINGSSASASELFAQTLKEYNRATVVGTNSYGKGTVVTEFKLSNGGALMMSTGYYTTKNGTYLEDIGVQPDIHVELPEEKLHYTYNLSIDNDDQIQAAIKVLETSLG